MLLTYIFTGLMFVSGQRSRGEVREEIIEAEWPDGREGQLALAKSYLAERGLKNPPERLRSEPRFFFWGHSGAFSLALRPDPACINRMDTVITTIPASADAGQSGSFARNVEKLRWVYD